MRTLRFNLKFVNLIKRFDYKYILIFMIILSYAYKYLKLQKLKNESLNVKNEEKKIIFIGGSPRSGTTVILLHYI
jgi:hypothetical protein